MLGNIVTFKECELDRASAVRKLYIHIEIYMSVDYVLVCFKIESG
jgi:hypothetical protein